MPRVAVCADKLSKVYRLGVRAEPYFTLREAVSGLGGRVARLVSGNGRGGDPPPVVWALKDVSFEIEHQEIVGIIGRNGAGKSTLLKVLSRITDPTSGRAEIHGRVVSLLEVGTGFHPELTGRDNVFLSGAVLGMRKAEIERKFDEIVAFAELEKFIDTPVKRFSSGMYLRLAFAVAAHLEADILLIDEVLAVGDANFQKKCLGKMGEVAGTGRTVLFVSHDMRAIQRLCRRAIVLSHGRVVMNAPVDTAIDEYLESGTSHRGERAWTNLTDAPGNDVARLLGVRLRDRSGDVSAEFDVRDPVALEVEYAVLKDGYQLCAVLEFISVMGHVLFVSFDRYVEGSWGKQTPYPVGVVKAVCLVPGDVFAEGDVTINLRIFSPPNRPNDHPHVRELDVLRFVVTDRMDPGGVRGSFPYEWGRPAVRPRIHWLMEHRPLEAAGR